MTELTINQTSTNNRILNLDGVPLEVVEQALAELTMNLYERKSKVFKAGLDELKIQTYYDAEEIQCMVSDALLIISNSKPTPGEFTRSIEDESAKFEYAKRWLEKLRSYYRVCKKAGLTSTCDAITMIVRKELTYEQKGAVMSCFNKFNMTREEHQAERANYTGAWKQIWDAYPVGLKPTPDDIKSTLEYTYWVNHATKDEIDQRNRYGWSNECYYTLERDTYDGFSVREQDAINDDFESLMGHKRKPTIKRYVNTDRVPKNHKDYKVSSWQVKCQLKAESAGLADAKALCVKHGVDYTSALEVAIDEYRQEHIESISGYIKSEIKRIIAKDLFANR